MAIYIPKRGDFIVIDFDPQSGHEQKGRRPALVISNDLFNKHTGMVMVCPLTNTDRSVPFHLPAAGNAKVTGFVMTEQMKSLDYVARHAKKMGTATPAHLKDVIDLIKVCID